MYKNEKELIVLIGLMAKHDALGKLNKNLRKLLLLEFVNNRVFNYSLKDLCYTNFLLLQ